MQLTICTISVIIMYIDLKIQTEGMVITMNSTINTNICLCCGSDFEYRDGRWKCRACGSYKPEELSNEESTLLYMASQRLRLAEFYEAEQEYDDIIRKYPKCAGAYWGRLMAKYGIKYEEDYDGKKIATCYATSIESVFSSNDYKMAVQYADEQTADFYRTQAEYIERVRKEWVEKAKKEKPYDVFICYKDSDLANGIAHTQDSDDMQELCIYLMEKGYRVFFSRVSLSNKSGEKYEPYIFNALATAKVMLVYGSRPEYVNSTWMKNEWTRYGRRLQAGEKHPHSLLVACKGFSPNELPAPLRARQCFDASKKRFYGDLVDTIERILHESPKAATPFSVRDPERMQNNDAVRQEDRLQTAFPIESTKTYARGLEYTVNKDKKTCTVKRIGSCKDTNVIIPEILDGYTVTAIGDYAFEGCVSITDFEIPDSVTDIGDYAFEGCNALEKIDVPDSVTDMGISVFSGCKNLESVRLPRHLKSIGYGLFQGCGSLTDIEIPSGITSIGITAFSECKNLTNVVIPNTVTSIGKSAFEKCLRLESISYGGPKKLWQKIHLHESWRNGSAIQTILCERGKIKLR